MKMNPFKILIADDSAALQERLAEMLAPIAGLKLVAQTMGVNESLNAIRQLRPDFVILDLNLADGNGLTVLRETKRVHPQTRLAIFTNVAELQYQQRCLDLGADYFLSKSKDSARLVEICAQLAGSEV